METKIDSKKLGVVIVDMQPSFLRALSLSERMELTSAHSILIRTCIEKDIPVSVLEYFGEGETVYPLIDEVKKVPRNYTFKKHTDNGFNSPFFSNELKKLNLETLCITGVNAAACVMETAEGALKEGYQILTAEDLIADKLGIGGVIHARNWFSEVGEYYDNHLDLLLRLK